MPGLNRDGFYTLKTLDLGSMYAANPLFSLLRFQTWVSVFSTTEPRSGPFSSYSHFIFKGDQNLNSKQ